MNYLLDTNHWSFVQRRHPVVLARIQSLPDEATLYMPVVAQAELLAGVELAPSESRKQQWRDLYEQVVAQATDILPITCQVAERYATLFADLRRKATPISTNDIWIAAIALTHGLLVVTNDADFQYVDRLLVEDWSTPTEMEAEDRGKQP